MGAITYTTPNNAAVKEAEKQYGEAYQAAEAEFQEKLRELRRPYAEATITLLRQYMEGASKLRHVTSVHLYEHRSPTDYVDDYLSYDIKLIAEDPRADPDVIEGMTNFFNNSVADHVTREVLQLGWNVNVEKRGYPRSREVRCLTYKNGEYVEKYW